MPATAHRAASPRISTATLTPRNPAITIRPVTSTDHAFCRALFDAQRAPMFAPLGLDASTLSTMLGQQYHAQSTGLSRSNPNAGAFVIAQEETPVGRVVADLVAEPAGRTLHLIDIAMMAAARGHGIGSDVIDTFARAAYAQGAKAITLSVLQTNFRARRLYERLGFAVTATTDTHITMVKALP